MSSIDWFVLLGATAAVGLTLWFFFGGQSREATAAVSGDRQEIGIEVRGGYTPNVARARAGVPLTLVFDRQDDSPCSEEIVISDFGIRRFLPAFEKTRVEIASPSVGRHEFTCGMGMLHGVLVVE